MATEASHGQKSTNIQLSSHITAIVYVVAPILLGFEKADTVEGLSAAFHSVRFGG